MPFLLRLSLPDVPGSLGRVATAIGEAGGDIQAIEIVESQPGRAIDDVLLEMAPGAMPDSVVSACTGLDDVDVLWISRYAAGGNLFLDLEVVEELTKRPEDALTRVVDLLPITFRLDWAVHMSANGRRVRATDAAPARVPLPSSPQSPARLADVDQDVLCAAPLGSDVVVVGRRGGPEFVDSELARLGHLLALADSIHR